MSRLETPVLAIVILLFSVWAFTRNMAWSNEVTLWTDTSMKSPGEARPHNNLGSALLKVGRYIDAIDVLKLSVEADPWYVEAHYNTALAFIKLRRYDEAIPELEEVLHINTVLKRGHYGARYIMRQELEAHANLGNILSSKGDYDLAADHYREALNINPDDASTRFNLGVTLKRAGRFDEARVQFERVLAIDPLDTQALANLRMLPPGATPGVPPGAKDAQKGRGRR